jgi:hypothetical protein
MEARGARGGVGVQGAWGLAMHLRGWCLLYVARRAHDKDFFVPCVFSKTKDKE